MKKIEITTAQNVTIEYQLAAAWERSLAFVIDFVSILVGTIVLTLIFALLDLENLLFVLMILWFFFYTLFFETILNGQTLGKLALGIRVVKLSGEKLRPQDSILRWSFRWIDLYFTGCTLGLLSVIGSPRGQRLGGILSDTVVIKTRVFGRFQLNQVLKLKTTDNYTPNYPGVKYLKNSEMLVVKEAIIRAEKHQNEAHKKAIHLLTQKIAKILEVPMPKNHIKFLKTVLKDYVVLTR